MNLPAGTQVGPYEVAAHLGVGGMGEVYARTTAGGDLRARTRSERGSRGSLPAFARGCGQGAKWLELRAARGYAHYLLKHDRLPEARDRITPICAWFTEGHDTLDYLYADGLLKTLS